MRSLHYIHEINAYMAYRVSPPVRMFVLENHWRILMKFCMNIMLLVAIQSTDCTKMADHELVRRERHLIYGPVTIKKTINHELVFSI
jgi:hypothetical protein